MSVLMWTNVVLVGVNLLLALVLAGVYAANLRQIRSSFTLGLLLFAAFLTLHNGVVLYHLITMMGPFSQLGEGYLLAENVLQGLALAALVRSTLR